MLVITAVLLPVGILAEVSLAVPGAELIQVKGIVRHTVQDLGMEREFLEVLPNHQVWFAAYMNKLGLAAGLAAAAV